MTLDLSRPSLFLVNPSEDSLVSSVEDKYIIGGVSDKNGSAYGNFQIEDKYIIGGVSDKNESAYGNFQHFDWEFGKDRRGGDKGGGSFELVGTNDITDLLPSDPFGMNVSATFTAIAGWVEDFEQDRLNVMWNRTLTFQSEKFLSVNNEDVAVASQQFRESGVGNGICHGVEDGAPNDALLLALGHLGIKDLLSAERVCKSLRSAIQGDVLLWKSIHIDYSLREKITDDALVKLTNRAQGNLQSLSLVACSRITDNGLKQVLECNPRLAKLNVAGCSGLTEDGIVNNLKAFKSSGASGINHLRIGGRYGLTRKHLEELNSLLGTDKCLQPNTSKPRYYHYVHFSPSCDDDRVIDIEICPRCENLRLVYDCPAERCQVNQPGTQICRACKICIARCVGCGRCVINSEYEEDFYLENLCSDCGRPERREKSTYSEHAFLHNETRYQISYSCPIFSTILKNQR